MKISKIIFSYLVIFGLSFATPFYAIQVAKAAQEMVNDSAITTAVKAKIAAEPSLNNTNIDVTTTDGVVKLSGEVASVDQMTTAAQLAQASSGVSDVDTTGVVITDKSAASMQPFTDALITAKVKGMFIQKKLFGESEISPMSISVETNNGIVSLSGTADTQLEIDNAIKIAKSIKNVKEVKSTVTIEKSKKS